MKKILVLGVYGMAGHMIYMYLKSLNTYEVFSTSHSELFDENTLICNIHDMEKVSKLIEELTPDIIINCIGILNVESDRNVINTAYINGFFPHYIEALTIDTNMKFIQISTDCVFSGYRGNYKDNDIKDDRTIYGITKNIGEIINNKDLTFRTSIIGPELKQNGKGLFNWFMNQSGSIDGYKNVYWTGVTTLELAKAIDIAIKENLTGLYQLVPNNKISKYDLLNIIKDVFSKDEIDIQANYDKKSDKSLICSKGNFTFKVKEYRVMIEQMYDWMINHKHMYMQYFK